jgi:O-antigen ligase
MKFQALFEILKNRMAGANFLPVFLLTLLVLVIVSILLVRYGSGFFLALAFILTGLLLIKSEAIAGLVLIARFPLVIILVLYAILSRKNRVYFSKFMVIFAVLPLVMLLDSAKAMNRMDALGQSIVFFMFYIGLLIGGERILGDPRGRLVFINTVTAFTIIISCMQIPFLSSSQGRLEGIFRTTVGYMIVGTAGVIIMIWLVLKQKVWSRSFIFFGLFAFLGFVLLLLTGGRTAMAGTLLGILVLLVRKLKRNLIIFLACLIILGPIGLELVVSFPGFENVKAKLFSTKDTRSHVWRYAWDEIQVKPWFGWGTGTAAIKSASQFGYGYHSTYLEFAVDHGIPFAVLMMLIFLWLPIRGLVLMRKCQTEEMKDMANLSSAILISYAFASFFGGVLNGTTFILPVYSVIALQEGIFAENKEMELYGYEPYYEEDSLLEQTSQEMWQKDYAGREQL